MKSHDIRISDENPHNSVTAIKEPLHLDSLWQLFSGNEFPEKTQSRFCLLLLFYQNQSKRYLYSMILVVLFTNKGLLLSILYFHCVYVHLFILRHSY